MVKRNKSEKKLKDLPNIEQIEELPNEPRFLSETDAIYFWADLNRTSETQVPPCTPQSIANLAILPSSFPNYFPTFDKLDVPYVREVGVRNCMQILGQHIGCTNYAYDYLQFWLLDILIDCLWKTQDEYYLHENEQKKVLEWIACIFKILTDPKACCSRKRFLKLFREMIFMAGDVLNEGNCEIPTPQQLFTLVTQKDQIAETVEEELVDEGKSQTSTITSSSTISISTHKSIDIIEMELMDQKKVFTIKRRKCWCHHDDISIDQYDLPTSLSSIITSAEVIPKNQTGNEIDMQANIELIKEEDIMAEEITDVSNNLDNFPNTDFRQFYQPDKNTPKRFLPLSRSSDDEEETSVESNVLVFSDDGGNFKSLKMDVGPDYKKYILPNVPLDVGKVEKKGEETQADEVSIRKEAPRKNSKYSQMQKSKMSNYSTTKRSISDTSRVIQKKSSKMRSKDNPNSKGVVKISMADFSDDQVMKKLQNYKLWEKILQDMDDPKTGWMPEQEEVLPEATINTDEDDWEDIVETDTTSTSEKNNEHLYFNLGVLCAIIDFVFDYFYRNFHFALIMLAAKTIPSVITQKLNAEWRIPKVAKQEFHRPKAVKVKKEKKPKTNKKSTKSKSSKSSSKASKKSKSGKGSKKDKKSGKGRKKGSDKKSKKSDKKSKKSQKLTKEQKSELERQRKLQHEQEIEKFRLEENKKFMFPLTDAATDDFFMNIFENWKKIKEHGKKGKKDKKMKKKK